VSDTLTPLGVGHLSPSAGHSGWWLGHEAEHERSGAVAPEYDRVSGRGGYLGAGDHHRPEAGADGDDADAVALGRFLDDAGRCVAGRPLPAPARWAEHPLRERSAPAGGGHTLYADRTFFGVYRVREDTSRHFVSLVHGTTTHGRQVIGDTNPEPLTYFHRHSPVGQVFEVLGGQASSVGVIGLGTGTLAAYAQPGSKWTFYEIDGAVERIARAH